MAVTELRDGLADWLNRVAWGGETLVVHRRGRPLALLVPFRESPGIPVPGAGEEDAEGHSPVPPPVLPPSRGEEVPPGEGGGGPRDAAPGEAAGDAGGGPGECSGNASGEEGGSPRAEGPAPGRERDRRDLRAIFRAIAASAGEVPRTWRPVRPGGPRVRLLAAAARELRALGGERRVAVERLLDLLAAGSLVDVPPLPGTAGRVHRFETREEGGAGLIWRREEDGSLTVLLLRAPAGGDA